MSRDASESRVVLASIDNDRVKSTLWAYFNAAGDLVLEGYDSGKLVEEVWGDDDYEYFLSVGRAEIPRLAEKLSRHFGLPSPDLEEERRAFVLGGVKKLFTEGASDLHFTSDSQFRKWLDEHQIPSKFSSWP
jgi:hypothetical protein